MHTSSSSEPQPNLRQSIYCSVPRVRCVSHTTPSHCTADHTKACQHVLIGSARPTRLRSTCAATPISSTSRSIMQPVACTDGSCSGEDDIGSTPYVPQRVLPTDSSASSAAVLPPETLEQQAAITAHLQDLYDHGGSRALQQGTEAATAPGGDGQVMQHPGTAPPHPLLLAGSSSRASSYSGPDSQVTRVLTFLNSSKISIGLDMKRAGTISWLSSSTAPVPWRNLNVVNTWDQGRLIQQSYYGCVDGSCWATRPWLWNPVQVACVRVLCERSRRIHTSAQTLVCPHTCVRRCAAAWLLQVLNCHVGKSSRRLSMTCTTTMTAHCRVGHGRISPD